MAKLLDLDKLYDRNIVRINGTEYQLRTNEELPPLTCNRLAADGVRVNTLANKQPISDTEKRELTDLPLRICLAVLIAPAAVIKKLKDEQRWSVCQAFLFQRNLSLIGIVATVRPPAPGATSTGAN
jgi:hypothetical protein